MDEKLRIADHACMWHIYLPYVHNKTTFKWTFKFQNLPSHCVVVIRLFYLTPVRRRVKSYNSRLLLGITIQPPTQVVNLLQTYNSRQNSPYNHKEDIYKSSSKVNTVPCRFTATLSDRVYMVGQFSMCGKHN